MCETLNIVDTAIQTGVFQTFTRLLEGSCLEKELRSKKRFTLFAPVDVAFADLPTETLNQLLRVESKGILADVLNYHAVPGKIMSADLKALSRAQTAHGEDLLVSNNGEVRIEGARLIQADIEAWNGVIHGIDRLLLPAEAVDFGCRMTSNLNIAHASILKITK